jgi:hypothetical protein
MPMVKAKFLMFNIKLPQASILPPISFAGRRACVLLCPCHYIQMEKKGIDRWHLTR